MSSLSINITSFRFNQTQIGHPNRTPRMMCLSAPARALLSSPLSSTFSPSKHRLLPHYSSPKNFSVKMSSSTQTIEHIVLYKVKDDTDPTKASSMVNALNGLTSLDNVVHLTAGPIHKNQSTAPSFTHLLHSRYDSKEDLSSHSAHPIQQSVFRESVLPICDDIMTVDWVNSEVNGPLVPKPGSAMRVAIMKLKEGLGDSEKDEVLGIMKGVKEYFPSIEQSSVGENFSPASAKGYSIVLIAVFPGLSELEEVDSSNSETVTAQKEKVRQYLDDVIVVDYVIPSSGAWQQSVSL